MSSDNSNYLNNILIVRTNHVGRRWQRNGVITRTAGSCQRPFHNAFVIAVRQRWRPWGWCCSVSRDLSSPFNCHIIYRAFCCSQVVCRTSAAETLHRSSSKLILGGRVIPRIPKCHHYNPATASQDDDDSFPTREQRSEPSEPQSSWWVIVCIVNQSLIILCTSRVLCVFNNNARYTGHNDIFFSKHLLRIILIWNEAIIIWSVVATFRNHNLAKYPTSSFFFHSTATNSFLLDILRMRIFSRAFSFKRTWYKKVLEPRVF